MLEHIRGGLSPGVDQLIRETQALELYKQTKEHISEVAEEVDQEFTAQLLPAAKERWSRWSRLIIEPLRPVFVEAALAHEEIRISVGKLVSDPPGVDLKIGLVPSRPYNSYFDPHNISDANKTIRDVQHLAARHKGDRLYSDQWVGWYEKKGRQRYTKAEELFGSLSPTVLSTEKRPWPLPKPRRFVKISELQELAQSKFEAATSKPISGIAVRILNKHKRLDSVQIDNPELYPPKSFESLDEVCYDDNAYFGATALVRQLMLGGGLSGMAARAIGQTTAEQLIRHEARTELRRQQRAGKLADRIFPLIMNSAFYKANAQTPVTA